MNRPANKLGIYYCGELGVVNIELILRHSRRFLGPNSGGAYELPPVMAFGS